MSAAAVHGQALPASARSDNWCGVWCTHDYHRWQTNQTANLGYSWPGGIQVCEESE